MRRAIGYFVAGLLLIAIGVFMIVSPDSFLTIGTAMFAVYMIFDGCRSLYAFFKYRSIPRGVRSAVLSKGIINIVLGIIVIALTVINPSVVGKNKNVVKLKLSDSSGSMLDAVYFGDAAGFMEYVSDKKEISAVFYPAINTFRGVSSIQLTITNYR